jgi:tRNA (guanine6-N2)-methyltransferase
MQIRYLATTLPGIGPIAKAFLSEKFGIKSEIINLRNNDILEFVSEVEPAELSAPSMLEDVFMLLGRQTLVGDKQDLIILKKFASSTNIVALAKVKTPKPSRTIRVVVQAEDAYWRGYRRMDIKGALELGLSQNVKSRLKVIPEDAQIELWAQQVENDLLISLRLTDRTMRHREYKVADYPGSLRPTVASAMAYLSKPKADDVVLDPMCGAGTIIVERALAGRHKLLLGFDKNPQAVEATLENLGVKHKPWEIRRGNATRLPLADGEIDVIITNPPWGVQMEADSDFYERILAECNRVLKPHGKLVILMSRGVLGRKIFAHYGFTLQSVHQKIMILGQQAEIFVCKKH